MYKYQGIVIVICVLAVAAYMRQQSIEESSIFSDEVVNEAFIKRLKDENVSVRVSDSGMVFYQIRYKDEVQRIRDEITEEYHPGREVRFYNPEREKLFLSTLAQYGIDYRIIERSDGSHITWKEEDDAQVNEIKEKLLSVGRQ